MTKQGIKDAAIQLISSQGYHACTMRRLASEVKLEVSSIYSHFNSKQEILAEICLDLMAKLDNGLDDIIQLRRTPIAQMEKFIDYYLKFQIENWAAFQIAHSEFKYLNLINEAAYKKFRKSFENKITEIINRGKDSGKFQNIDSQVILIFILSSLRWRFNTPKKLEKLYKERLNEIYQLILKGILQK